MESCFSSRILRGSACGLGFGGKTSSRFIFLLLFINVLGIGASRGRGCPRARAEHPAPALAGTRSV